MQGKSIMASIRTLRGSFVAAIAVWATAFLLEAIEAAAIDDAEG
jgi:hypothetical protein